ncbi:hypothetical protein OC861_005905 [Tilletia horrida]|nr:hypothetical protein OC861_005905 [Tilletia horrida]
MLLPFCPRSARSALFLAFLILTTLAFVLADPVVQADSAPALLATRGSAQAGDKCTTNTDCYSKNCVNKVCQLQPAGGPCFKDGNCVSKSCSIPKGKTAGTCASTGSLPPRAACTANAQCLSGSCSSRVDRHDQYGDNTGFYLSDDIGHQGKNCQYLSLGQSGCRSNDDCGSGVCSSNGKCTALADGSRCLFNSQCGSSSVCSIKGKCYTPRPGSLTTGKVCTKDSQCYAGNCFKFNTTLVRPALQGNGTVTLADETCDQAYLRQLCHTDTWSANPVLATLPADPASAPPRRTNASSLRQAICARLHNKYLLRKRRRV